MTFCVAQANAGKKWEILSKVLRLRRIQIALTENVLGQDLSAFMALALQPAECRCWEQLLPTQIMEFGEERLLGTDL